MLAKLAHRGPDDEGIYRDDHISIGHKRLSIIDIEGGHQPMASKDDRYIIAYNGEIYNYVELRGKLRSLGYEFKTRSDTEVLLYWLVEHGIAGLAELNGMFALVFWDSTEKKLLLARDRLGIKPLYYFQKGGGVIFASEIKAMLPLVDQKEADLNTIYEFLTFQNILGERTFFKNIRKLLPGHWLQWWPSGMRIGTFWDILFQEDYDESIQKAAEEYAETLESAVKRHMISDVPIGAYLSGGFDSSSVVTFMAKESSSPVHSFTGAFIDAPYYDEREGSRAVAKKTGAVIHEIEITPSDYLENIGKVIYHLDEPTLGTGAFPQYMVSKLVSQHVKVVLTGHGGDEMFAGYQVNKVALLKETVKRNPCKLPSTLLGIRRDEWSRVLYYLIYPLRYPEVGSGLFIMVPKKRRRYFFSEDFLAQNSCYEPINEIGKVLGNNHYSAGEEILALYLKTYLPTLFIQEDKVGMAHSIEARIPLCDNKMIDLALKIPLKIKIWNNQLKAVTKVGMRSFLPDILYKLPKRGFPTPFAKWYRREPLRSFMEEILLGSGTRDRGIFNAGALKLMFEKNLSSKTDTLYDYARANMLYSASIVELWFRTFMDQKDPMPVC